MRLSKSGWVTLKEIPKDAEVVSHQLMIRAGMIHRVAGGIYNYMPFGLRTLRKIENIVQEEMNAIDCLEITMSMVTPAELWKETKRWDIMGPLMARFKDRADKDMCLSPTNEETVTDLFRTFIHSYKQLPITFYQINTKFRDEIRPRFGLMRGREFIMKDAYSFHANKDCLDQFYNRMYQAYEKIFSRMGLEFIAVEADGGAMASGESKTHEFQVIANNGEDRLVYCAKTGWAANIERANTKKVRVTAEQSTANLEKVATPLKNFTMEEAVSILKRPMDHCLKSVLYKLIVGKEIKFVMALMLGNDEVNEVKLKNHFGADQIVAVTEPDLKRLNLIRGFIGPINLTEEVSVVVDQEILATASYATGANENGFHYINFVLSRDLKNKYTQVDLRLAQEGDLTADGHPVTMKKGIEVGHIFQLGDKYTKSMQATVLDMQGKKMIPLMGCYGIGVSRLMAATIEQHNDANGIVWPISVAPYQIHLCRLAKTAEMINKCDELYVELKSQGFEVLYDDRDISPGVMFKDADLLGLPIRILFGERDFVIDQSVEVKLRSSGESQRVPLEKIIPVLMKIKSDLFKKCSK